MGVCCVEGCEPTDSDDVTYFPFPIKPVLLRKWRAAIKTTEKLHTDSKVCSRHFSVTDYERVRGKLRLKGRVVPSVFDYTKSPSRSPSPPKCPPPREDTPTEETPTEETPTEETPTEETPTEGTPIEETPTFGIAETRDSIEDDFRIPLCQQILTENGEEEENCTIECIPEAILHGDSESNSDSELHKEDIEDIIANYHIKQDRSLAERLREDSEKEGEKRDDKKTENKENEKSDKDPSQGPEASRSVPSSGQRPEEEVIEIAEDPGHRDPVYIEISADAENKSAPESTRDDCLMVLENVEVDIDPSTLMLENEDAEREDPISLLTSSDEDDVIIQEPHIDTVEVSDETDEDDVPLVNLVKENKPIQTILGKILWGNVSEYYCYQCHFTTTRKCDFKKHKLTHSKIIQVCDVCNFTTASQVQFSRHKKRHKEEKRYKCHLCEYKAKHNMSLLYHLKSHEKGKVTTIIDDDVHVKKIKHAFRCQSCPFKSNVRQEMLKHVKSCNDKRYACDICDYRTKRRSDLKRHREKRHLVNDDDEDEDE